MSQVGRIKYRRLASNQASIEVTNENKLRAQIIKKMMRANLKNQMPMSSSNIANGMTSKMMNFGDAGVQPDPSPPRNNKNRGHQYSPSAGYQSDP